MKTKKHNQGFTLLEILLVVGIIAILAGIVIIAINPSKQLATVRNAERKSDVLALHNALQQYYIDNSKYPDGVDTLNEVCDTGALTPSSVPTDFCTGLVNLSVLVPTYLTAIPKDPMGSVTNNATGYSVVNAGGRIGLSAVRVELGTQVGIGTLIGGGGNSGPWVPISGLVAHYLMNDTDGTTALDNTSNHNDGTGSYAPTEGKIGGGLGFDGGSNYIDFNTPSSMYSFPLTYSAWIYIPSSYRDGVNVILGAYNNVETPNAPSFGISPNGNLNTSFVGSGGGGNGADVVPLNSWHLVTLVMNGTDAYFYIDGVPDSAGPISFSGDFTAQPITTIGEIYAYPPYDTHWFDSINGKLIDDVRIYNRVLSSDEISQIYNGGVGTEAE